LICNVLLRISITDNRESEIDIPILEGTYTARNVPSQSDKGRDNIGTKYRAPKRYRIEAPSYHKYQSDTFRILWLHLLEYS
jgi:hypothetical protein